MIYLTGIKEGNYCLFTIEQALLALSLSESLSQTRENELFS